MHNIHSWRLLVLCWTEGQASSCILCSLPADLCIPNTFNNQHKHTHTNTSHISQPEITAKHFFSLTLSQSHTFTWIHSHANTHPYTGVHVLVSGCLQPRLFWGWRHSTHQGIMGFKKKNGTGAESSNHLRRFVLWIGDKNYGMCSVSLDKTDTHDPSQSPPAFDWWLKLSLRPEQPMSTPLMLWHTVLLIVFKVKFHQSLSKFFFSLAKNQSHRNCICCTLSRSSLWTCDEGGGVFSQQWVCVCACLYMHAGCVDVCIPRAWRVCVCVQH